MRTPAGETDPTTAKSTIPELPELLDVAMEAAATAVELIHTNRPASLQVHTKSSATDHVTNMDIASEDAIRRVITTRRPHDSLLGEEHGGTIDPERLTWVIDPIDGTTNYLYDHPGYAVSIAAMTGGTSVVGVVADPTHGRTYRAALDMGAHCVSSGSPSRAIPLNLSAPPPLDEMLVATGFGYESGQRAGQGLLVASLLPRIRDIRRMGAAANDLCSVASGRVDAYYEAGLSIWDLAAGQLVASEAGASVEAIEGGPAKPGSVLVAHPDRIGALRSLLFECGAADALGIPDPRS